MAAGSWARFFIGFLLAIEMIRLALSGEGSSIGIGLAVIYFILVAAYAFIRV